MKKLIVCALSACLFSSCATILDGSRTRVKVHGFPNDAKVYFNGAYQGTGSETIAIQKSAVKKGRTAKITVTKDGYKPAEITLSTKTRVGFIVLDIAFGVVPLVLDVITGNLSAVRPGNVEYNLEKEKTPFVAQSPNDYAKSLIGKKVTFSHNGKTFEGTVINTYENREANIKYTDEMGTISTIYKKFTDFKE